MESTELAICDLSTLKFEQVVLGEITVQISMVVVTPILSSVPGVQVNTQEAVKPQSALKSAMSEGGVTSMNAPVVSENALLYAALGRLLVSMAFTFQQ